METTIERESSRGVPIHMQQIGLGEKLAFGCGDVALNVIWTSVLAFLVFFYTDVAGIGAAIIGTMMLVVRVFDGFVDIGAGIVVDRTKSRYGKARPWLLWMALPFGISTVLLFTVPNLGASGKIIYAFATYTLVNIIYSATAIPYGVLNAMITQDQYQRSVLNIFRMIMAMCTALVISVCTMGFVKALGDGPQAWQTLFIIYAAVAVALFLTTFTFTKERVKSPVSDREKSSVPLKIGFKALITNKYWVIVVILAVTLFIMNGLLGVYVYFAKYVLGNSDYVAPLMMSVLLPLILTMFCIAPLIKRFGKRNVALAGAALSLLGGLVIMIDPTSLVPVIAGNIVKGIAIAPLTATMFALVADTIEYGQWKSGVRTEGLIYSAASLGTKVGAGLGAALIGWLLAAGGYISGAQVQPRSLITSIYFAFIYVPMILAVLQIVLLWFYKLDKEYPKIAQELHERTLAGENP